MNYGTLETRGDSASAKKINRIQSEIFGSVFSCIGSEVVPNNPNTLKTIVYCVIHDIFCYIVTQVVNRHTVLIKKEVKKISHS